MVAAILEGGRVTIDVAKLRRFAEEAGWPSVSPSEFVELLDAYEERDLLRGALALAVSMVRGGEDFHVTGCEGCDSIRRALEGRK